MLPSPCRRGPLAVRTRRPVPWSAEFHERQAFYYLQGGDWSEALREAGEALRLTHTKNRQKYRNLQNEPRVALSIADPDDQLRFLEIRGVVESIVDDDDTASFYKALQHRYGEDYEVTDVDVRVVVTIRPTRFIAVKGGSVQH